MTKEELEKEAEDIVYGMGYDTYESDGHSDFAVQDILVKSLESREKRIAELETQIKQMKCCENCGWFYLQQHWRESKEINESRMFHCGTCGNKKNWKLKEIKENE